MTVPFMNREPFSRLRWNVFGSFGDIQVEIRSGNEGVELCSFQDHPITEEQATLTGLAHMEVYLDPVDAKRTHDKHDEEERYKPFPHLQLGHKDDSTITVGDFVSKVHEYLNTHKEEIIEVLEEAKGVITDSATGNVLWSIREDTRFFFWDCGPQRIEETAGPTVSVEIYAEGEDERTIEEFWQSRSGLIHSS